MYNGSLCSACRDRTGSSKGCLYLLHANEYIALNRGGEKNIFVLAQLLISFHDFSFADTSHNFKTNFKIKQTTKTYLR